MCDLSGIYEHFSTDVLDICFLRVFFPFKEKECNSIGRQPRTYTNFCNEFIILAFWSFHMALAYLLAFTNLALCATVVQLGLTYIVLF